MDTVSTRYSGFISKIMSADRRSIQAGFLCLAIFIYGAFGSPTPDNPGAVEVVIAALLVLSVGVSGAWSAVRFDLSQASWVLAGKGFLLFGLSAPLLGGVLAGNAPGLILRDMIPFLFMGLPLFLAALMRLRPDMFKGAVFSVLVLGVLFALRVRFDLPVLGKGEELYYLANMPSVLFGAIFFAGLAVQIFVTRFSVKSVLSGIVLAGLAGLCLWPVIETQQRASVGVFVLSLGGLWVLFLWRAPRRCLALLAIMTCASLPFMDEMRSVFEALSRKTELVGVNMRVEEWQSVWAHISAHPLGALVGSGWGATFSSPAVADIQVNFTHGLLSSLLLKTGLVGLSLGIAYLVMLGRVLAGLLKTMPVLAIALAGPILIDVFLYASFKSLDFGLVLMLIPAAHFYGEDHARGVASPSGVLYSDRVAK